MANRWRTPERNAGDGAATHPRASRPSRRMHPPGSSGSATCSGDLARPRSVLSLGVNPIRRWPQCGSSEMPGPHTSAVEVSHRAFVDEQGIRRRPIWPPQCMNVAAQPVSHARAGCHAARLIIRGVFRHPGRHENGLAVAMRAMGNSAFRKEARRQDSRGMRPASAHPASGRCWIPARERARPSSAPGGGASSRVGAGRSRRRRFAHAPIHPGLVAPFDRSMAHRPCDSTSPGVLGRPAR
jgi:hypothetical protein